MHKSKARRALLLAGASMLLVSLLAPFAARADVPGDEQSFVQLINKTRAAAGVAPVRLNAQLVSVGEKWADEMRKADAVAVASDPMRNPCIIAHNPNLAEQVTGKWTKLGENVGCGDITVDAIHTMFVNSPHHYANIVDPRFNNVGVGIVYQGDMMFVTEVFMELKELPVDPNVPNAIALVAPVTVKPKTVPTVVPSTLAPSAQFAAAAPAFAPAVPAAPQAAVPSAVAPAAQPTAAKPTSKSRRLRIVRSTRASAKRR